MSLNVNDVVNVYNNQNREGVVEKGKIISILPINDVNEKQKYTVDILDTDGNVKTQETIIEDFLSKFEEPIDSSKIVDPTTATTALDPTLATTAATTTTTADPKTAGGYSFVGDKIFKVTQDATNGTCVKAIEANEIDANFINDMKNTLGMSGGSKSANKKNKITCKKKGGRKHKKSMKHKKGAKKW